MGYRYILGVCILAACSSTGTSTTAPAPRADSTLEIVVANQQSASASILNADGLTMKHVTVGNGPHEAAISRDGKWAIVTIYGAQQPGNQLAVIDLERDSVVRTISLGQYTRPHGGLFIGSSNTLVAVTSESTRNLVIVNIATGTVETAIPTEAAGSHMVALTRDGSRAYTGNVGGASVSEIDLNTRKLLRTFTGLPAQPEGIGVTPDGAEVWVGSNATGAVSVISTATWQITHNIPGSTFPYRFNPSPDGRVMAIVDAQASRVHFVDVATKQVTRTVQLPQPRGVTIGSDNKTAYITLAAGSLAVVDIPSGGQVRTIAVQASPDGVAVGVRR